ncbi:uncharacterized protein LOC120709608 [Panicum virgatum]|uniref:uncharacterized protein LOC120709608 n=1 Tax=Panicum virgatum TaxID=38727 RepID=UPI0019D5671D|nr:uncharacterized protein LOC120709608 [Panicum virgatum]
MGRSKIARAINRLRGAPCPSAPLDSVDDLAEDPDVWCALEMLEKAAGIATRVHDGLEGARGHLRAAALLAALDGDGVGGGGEGGDSTAPWEQSPCFAEQLNGAMELGEAMLKARELVAETAGAREAAFGFIGGAK